MILDELVVHNLGVFGGRHVFNLTPPSSKQPIVLVGGLNGAGKTTFLEAIHLALYGPLAQPSSRRIRRYGAYLRSSIHHATSPAEGAAVELAFHIHQAGSERHFRIHRSWRDTGSGIRERLEVRRDGKVDATLAATWGEHVEALLPRGIAGLFFFDGEQIEELADLDASGRVLKSALAALLGLDMVDRLSTDLAVIRRRHRGNQVPDDLRQRVEESRRRVTEARQDDEAAAAEVATTRVEVERIQKQLFELTEEYRSAGGELLDQQETAEKRAAAAREDARRGEDELRELAAGSAPLLQLTPLIAHAAEQAHKEVSAARQRLVADVVDDRDTTILDLLRNEHVGSSALRSLEQFLDSDRDQRRAAADVEQIVSIDNPGSLEFLKTVALPELQHRAIALLRRRRKILSALEDSERLLASIPDSDAIGPLRERRDAALAKQVRVEAALAHAEERQRALQVERARRESAYERAMDDAARATLAAEDDRRLIEHAERARRTLEDFKAAAISRHLGRICELVLDALHQLLRKDKLVTSISIDPQTYTVQLFGSDVRPLEAQQLSAGERQLLAVALVWGLARASRQPLPVIIDTPLGRLDRSHRHHLVQRYFPHASHQVVLLSTDTEIDELSFAELQPHIGHAYQLDFDSTTGASTVRPGYFWDVNDAA